MLRGLACSAILALALSVAGSARARDGEGTAVIDPPDKLVAGSTATITVTCTVGGGGIPVGGGLALGFHHASGWGGLQIKAPGAAGYMTVTCDTPDNFELEWIPWMSPRERRPHKGDGIFHRCLFARVKRVALDAGERVRFCIGANELGTVVQKHVEKTAEFRVMTDVDGDGVYKGIADPPIIEIVPDVPHHLAGSLPSTVVVEEPFELLIRAEDRLFNLATDYNGRVVVEDDGGRVLAADVPLRRGMTRITLTFRKPGPQRLRLRDRSLEGRSNPCRVFHQAPEYRIYWGDIHGHTNISDGLADTAADYFAFGRDVADLDVCALTDHGHFDWPQTQAAVREFHEPGRYVTILGQEGGSGFGHMNLYFRDDDEEHISAWPKTYESFLKHVLEQYGAEGRMITGPHHFTYRGNGKTYPFESFDQRIARFVEVCSMHGTSEYFGNPRLLSGANREQKGDFLQAGLAGGLRFGVIGSSDCHASHPGRTKYGRYAGGLVAFVARELTREAIWDSFWNYHVYATTFDRVYMEFTIDDRIVGNEVSTDSVCRVKYYVIGRTDNMAVFLIRNNEEIRKDSTDTGVVEVSFRDYAPVGENFYYLRVVQDNGEQAWSTPIWVTRE